jgi:hypothetical protein
MGTLAYLFRSGRTACQTGPPTLSKIDIDALRADFGELLGEVAGPMIDDGVEAKFVLDEAALVCTASNPDGQRSLDPRDLADERSDGPAGRRDHDGLALLRTTDVQEPRIGGEARHPQHAECSGDRIEAGIQFGKPCAVGHDMRQPAELPQGHLAGMVIRMVRTNDLRDYFTFHDAADGGWW